MNDSQNKPKTSNTAGASRTAPTSGTARPAKTSGRHKGDSETRQAPVEVLRQARTQLGELTGVDVEKVTSFEETEDGWSLEIEVLELSRVPDTMSLMASYQVDLDPAGQLTGYRRVGRYERGRSDARRQGGR